MLRVQGSRLRVLGLRPRVQGSRLRVQGLMLGVQGLRLMVQGLRLRVYAFEVSGTSMPWKPAVRFSVSSTGRRRTGVQVNAVSWSGVWVNQ